ncbi:hypothetical protein C8Q77DRAFT_1150560 [Trametes polyzona]|nr:hypothetical protein C8Q77DRAFT_1150560 [Trametes polyzona]
MLPSVAMSDPELNHPRSAPSSISTSRPNRLRPLLLPPTSQKPPNMCGSCPCHPAVRCLPRTAVIPATSSTYLPASIQTFPCDAAGSACGHLPRSAIELYPAQRGEPGTAPADAPDPNQRPRIPPPMHAYVPSSLPFRTLPVMDG